MLGKKGFEMQFNWIFVLIAGAIILMFFFLVLKNQINNSAVEDATKTQSDVDFLFRGSQGSRASEKVIALHGTVSFDCSDGVSTYGIEGSPVLSQYNYLAVFSPKSLTGNEMLMKTDFFSAPFHVMPFTYVTDKNIQYLFVGDNPETLMLLSEMPENATKLRLTSSLETFPDNNFNELVIVAQASDFQKEVFSHRLLKFAARRYGSIKAVAFEAEGGILNSFGSISFYDYTDSGFVKKSSSSYFTFEQLLGAAFSGDGAIYQCQFDKSTSRINMVSRLQQDRIAQLLSYPQIAASCQSQYGSISGNLDEMQQLTKGNVSAASVPALFQDIQAIQILNNAVVSSTNCPPIY